MALDETQWSWCDNMRPEQESAVSAWQYFQALPNDWQPGPGTIVPFGVLPRTNSYFNSCLLVTYDLNTRVIRLFALQLQQDETHPATTWFEVLHDGVGVKPTRDSNARTAPMMAFLDGWIVITVGAGGSGYSMLRWDGIQGSTYSTIAPAGMATFRAAYLESFSAHLIAC